MCLLRLFHKKNAARPAGIRIGETGFTARTAGQPLSGRASALFSLFEKDPAKLSGEERALRAETEEAFLKAGARIGKCPVDIGASFVLPIALAKFLVIRGFTVRSVRAAAFLPEERGNFAWLAAHFPAIRLEGETEDTGAALYLDGREPVLFDTETETLKGLAEKMAETAGRMHFTI